MRTAFLSQRFRHHGQHTGYHILARQWPDDRTIYFLPRSSERRRAFAFRRIASSLLEARRRQAKRNIRGRVLQENVDILHVLYGESDLPFPVLPAPHRLVASLHQPVSHLGRSADRIEVLKRQVQDVDLVIALSSELEAFLRELLPGRRVEFVPHGVDTGFFRNSGEQRDRAVLVSCGWYRDLELARQVIRELAKREPGLRIKAYGGGAQQLAQVSPRLQVLTGLSDEQLRHEYCACGLMFLPLREAVANNALLEAMSCDATVVAPALPAVSQYLGATDTCYQPALPPEGVADFIYQLLEKPIAGLAPRSRALEFSWQLVARQMQALYGRLCG